MAEQIIDARVWTKVDTLENWNNNPMLLGPGEMALVTSDSGIPMNMKWGDKTTRKRFSDLPFAISYDQGQFVAVSGTTLPASDGNVHYSLVGEGTYTRAGQSDVVVSSGNIGVIVDDGTTWSLGSTVALPDNSATALPWSPGVYEQNKIVTHNNQQWISLSETNQEPNVDSNDWKILGSVDNNLIASVDAKEYVAAITDSDDSITHKFNVDGDITSYLFPYGIQKEFDDVDVNIEYIHDIVDRVESESLLDVLDADYNIVSTISSDGSFYVTGLDKSVQESILELQSGDNSKTFPDSSKIDTSQYTQLVQDAKEILLNRSINGLSNFPVFGGVLKQDFVFPINEIQTLTSSLSTEYVPIGMMNGGVFNPNSGVVHPNVVEFQFPVNGYKYWMTLNGYPDESWEITWLYGTNNEDLTGWELISEVPQPFEDNPQIIPPYISSHDSDSFMTYDVLRGEIIVAWRRTMRWEPSAPTGQTNEYRYRTSTNGKTWSDVKILIPPVTADIDLMQSASIIYNSEEKLYYYFDVYNALGVGWRIKYRTNKDVADNTGWSSPTFIDTPSGIVPWHLEVKYVGKTTVMLLHQNQLNSPGNDKLWFAATNDMTTWVWGNSDIFGGTSPMYKGSFIPVYNGDGTMFFKVIYTTDERAVAGEQWRLHITDTNTFNI